MLPQFTAHRTILRGNAATRGNIATLMFVGSNPDKLVTHTSQNHKVVVTGEFRGGSSGGTVTVQQFAIDGTTQIGGTLTINSANPSHIIQMMNNGVYLHFVAGGNNLLVASLEVQTRADCAWNDLPATQFSTTIETSPTPNSNQAHRSIATTGTASTLATLTYVKDPSTGTLLIQVNGGAVRMTLNGTAPTSSTGFLILDGGTVQLSDTEITTAKFITGTGSPVLEIIGYK